MGSDVSIRVEEIKACLLCQQPGTPLYGGLKDRLYGAPGIWGFMQCPRCRVVWLNPRPLPEDTHKVYTSYYTHAQAARRSALASWKEKTKRALYAAVPGYSAIADSWSWRLVGRALGLVPSLKEIAKLGIMCLDDARRGKLLEVGCGNGEFLFLMRKAGWEVQGVEPDPVAAKLAEELFAVPVIAGTLAGASLRDESFDAVTLCHVIEHVYDPIALLRECARVLKPKGKLVVLTPNVESRGHQVFQDSWRELDPPRHVYLFSLETLRRVADRSGIQINLLRTSSRNARGIWTVSSVLKAKGVFSDSDATWRLRLGGLAFQAEEASAQRTCQGAGEELLLIASRRG